MIQHKEVRDKYYKLLLDIRKSNPAEAILMLTAFYNEYYNEDEDNKLKNGIAHEIADNLRKQGKLKEALKGFEELLHDPLLSDMAYHSALVSSLGILIQLNQKEDAFNMVETYLEAKHNNSFYYLSALFWYVKNAESSEVQDLEKYRLLVEKISNDLEFDIEESDLKKAITILAEENHKSNIRYSEVLILILSHEISKDEAKKRLKEYIESEKVGFYKNLALQKISEFERSH